jgi:S-DNA-T family DNA segregation ATPase FtsK/SpoIIIE
VWLILATQRPSSQIVDTALRDLFGYRCAFRCTTGTSSDIVLGHGWAANGYDASLIDPLARGVAWLLAEDGLPRRIKVAYLDDGQVAALARRAALLRGRA